MAGKHIEVVTQILGANQRVANEIRRRLIEANVLSINLISSPGSGKTLLIEKTIPLLQNRGIRCGVIAGDIATNNDAVRISSSGIPVVQITTESFGGACHLEAPAVLQAIDHLPLQDLDVLIIENVGNLVCPAEFDVGQAFRVVMLSVTEGEDKPLKYPLAFRLADCCLVSKIDLLPHLDLSIEKLRASIARINSNAPHFEISSRDGTGLDRWINWLSAANEDKAHYFSHHNPTETGSAEAHTHHHHN